MAERVGFEPTVILLPRLISSQVHSTTLPPLLCVEACEYSKICRDASASLYLPRQMRSLAVGQRAPSGGAQNLTQSSGMGSVAGRRGKRMKGRRRVRASPHIADREDRPKLLSTGRWVSLWVKP